MRLFILTLLFINFSAFGNYAKLSEVQSSSISKVWTTKKACGESCIELPNGYNPAYHDLIDEQIDDKASPIYETESNVVACSDESDCIAKEAAHVCDVADGYFVVRFVDNSRVYCTKLLGYQQVLSGRKVIQINALNKASYDAAKASKDAQEAAVKQALLRMNQGRRVMAVLLVRNSMKGLNKGQIKTMNTTYASIKDLLETGSLETAKDEIAAIAPDGVIVTEDDKTALITEINSFLGL